MKECCGTGLFPTSYVILTKLFKCGLKYSCNSHSLMIFFSKLTFLKYDFFSFSIGSRDASSNSEANQKPSDNWKETKRKRKEKEDQKSKRRKENTETELESRASRSVIAPVPGGKQADAEQATRLERNKNQKADVRTEDTEYLSDTNALSGKCVDFLPV